MLIDNSSFRQGLPESSHKDVKLVVATKPFSNTYAADVSPSMALDSGILSRNDGNGAIMRIAGASKLALTLERQSLLWLSKQALTLPIFDAPKPKQALALQANII